MDAFAALKGTLAQRAGAAAEGLQGLRRDRQAAVQGLSLSAAAARRRHARPGRRRALPARRALFAKFGTATAWFTPELLTIPQATMDQWIAQTPALAPYRFSILDNYRQQAHVLDEKGERLLSLRGPVQRRAARRLPGAAHVRHQVSEDQACRRQGGRRSARQLPAAARDATTTRPIARRRRGRARRHLRRDREHLRRDLQRRAAARLVPRAGAQLPDARSTPRSTATRSRRRWSRRWSTRPAPAPRRCSATRRLRKKLLGLRRPTTCTTASSRSSTATKTYPYDEGARARALVGRAARRRLRRAKYRKFVSGGRDRRLRERRQAQRRVQRRRLRRRAVPAAELQRHARRRVHARARGRPRDAHGAVVRDAAVRHRRLHDLRRRGRVDDERALPARQAAAEDHRPEGALPAAAARGRLDRRHVLHAGAVRRLRAAGAPAGREGRAGDAEVLNELYAGAAEGVLRRCGDGRRPLQVHLGAHPAFLQHAVLRLPVRDVLRVVGAAVSTR